MGKNIPKVRIHTPPARRAEVAPRTAVETSRTESLRPDAFAHASAVDQARAALAAVRHLIGADALSVEDPVQLDPTPRNTDADVRRSIYGMYQ